MSGWNIRGRLLVVCSLFVLPLLLTLLLYGELVRREVDFLDGELTGVHELRAAWAGAAPGGTSEPARRFRIAAGGTLILDDHADTYRLAHALTSSLFILAKAAPAVGDEALDARSRQAALAAADLSEAAGLIHDPRMAGALKARATQVRGLIDDPRPDASALAEGWWRQTLDDTERLLQARRSALIRQVLIQIGLIAAVVGLAIVLARQIVRGLSHRVERLVDRIESLIANDTTGQTPYLDDPHEIGRIAKGVEALKRALVEARGAWGDLLLNETRYLLLAENVRDVVLLCEPDGAVLFASPSAQSLGCDPDALEGLSAWDLFDEQDAKALRSLAAGLRGEVGRPACRAARSEGLWRVALRRPDEDDDGLLLVASPAS